jgi:hypothetical protein
MRKLVLFFMVITISTKVASQTNIVHANRGQIQYTKRMHNLKYGNNLILEIENINPFITKTYSETKPINYDFSIAEFQKLTLKEGADKVGEKEKELIKEVGASSEKVMIFSQNLSFSNEQYNTTKSYLQNFKYATEDKYLKLTKTSQIVDSLNVVLNNQMQDIEKYKNEIKALTNLTDEQKKLILKLQDVTKAKNEFLEDFKNFQYAFDKVNNYSLLHSLLANQIKESLTFIQDTAAFKRKAKTTMISLGLKDAENTKKDIVVQIYKLGALYASLSANYQKINQILNKRKFEFNGELKDEKNTLKISKMIADFDLKYFFEDEMKKVKAINDSLSLPKNKLKIIHETFKGCDLFTEIDNHSYTSTLSSNFIYDDKADIIFQIKNEKNEVLHSYPTIKVKTYNQIKINGSAGYFLNFISDTKFETYKKENDPKNYLREGSKSKIKNALGGLIHAYYNISPSFATGLSAGLSINDDANASFYLGSSFFFTETNRLVLTTGLSFVKVDTLNTANLFTDDKNNYYYTDTNYQLQYEKVYKPSFFIGITYNLF